MALDQWNLPMFGIDYLSRQITFTDSCRYDIGKNDQPDWNKLFGMSFGLFPTRGIRPVHYSSIRFGWRYNTKVDKMEVAPYYYIKGKRYYPEVNGSTIFGCHINKPYDFKIDVKNSELTVNRHKWIIKGLETKSYGWSLPLYFGGNKPVPHNLEIISNKTA